MGSFVVIVEWIALFLGAAVTGALLGLLGVRWRIVRRVRAELGREKVLLVTNSRVALMHEGRKVGGLTEAGILMLLKSGLYYHSWLSRREIFIPGAAITYIGVSDGKNGHAAFRGSVVLRFLNALGKEDEVIIRLLSPDQWVSAIKTHLIGRPV
jgi:hypothetical protein